MSEFRNILIHKSMLQMPLMSLSVKSMVVSVGQNRIFISPGSKLSDEDYKEISDVTDIVAPNWLHSGGVLKAHQHFPYARLWFAPGLDKQKPRIPWTDELSAKRWPYQDELPMVFIEGAPKLNEVVFFHRESRTLIVCDLFFHMVGYKGIGAWIVQHIFDTYDRFAISRLLKMYVKDRVAAEKSARLIMKFDFDKIIMSHGKVVEKGGREMALRAFQERGFLKDFAL